MLHAGQYRATESRGTSVIIRKNVMRRKVGFVIVILVFVAGGDHHISEKYKSSFK